MLTAKKLKSEIQTIERFAWKEKIKLKLTQEFADLSSVTYQNPKLNLLRQYL